jgi:hypothetical protein
MSAVIVPGCGQRMVLADENLDHRATPRSDRTHVPQSSWSLGTQDTANQLGIAEEGCPRTTCPVRCRPRPDRRAWDAQRGHKAGSDDNNSA